LGTLDTQYKGATDTTMAIWKLVLDALIGLLTANMYFLLWYPVISLACEQIINTAVQKAK
jgi:hypothetical protein